MSNNRHQILIVDDNTKNIQVAANILKNENYVLGFATSGREALEKLETKSYDLILMDVMMPGIDGFETVRELKSNDSLRDIPVIFVTALDDEESIEKAFDVGGADYVSKPFRSKELIARTKYHLERRDLIKQLEYLASRDILTGIYNRRKFFELAIDLFEITAKNLFGIMIDIDRFKSINDTHGHQIGDQMLKMVAGELQKNLPKSAVLGRIGGEEFAVVVPMASLQEAQALCERLRDKIENSPCEPPNTNPLYCTISLGMVEKSPDIQTLDNLLNQADKMLYQAKRCGRNRTFVRGDTPEIDTEDGVFVTREKR